MLLPAHWCAVIPNPALDQAFSATEKFTQMIKITLALKSFKTKSAEKLSKTLTIRTMNSPRTCTTFNTPPTLILIWLLKSIKQKFNNQNLEFFLISVKKNLNIMWGLNIRLASVKTFDSGIWNCYERYPGHIIDWPSLSYYKIIKIIYGELFPEGSEEVWRAQNSA